MTSFPTLRFLPASFGFLAVTAAGLVVTPARAGTSCDSDGACGKGFTCQVVGGTGCASAACPPGADCPAPPPCEPTEIKECVPGPCTADSDCAAGMKCYTHTESDCSAGESSPCQAGADCPPPPEPVCSDKTISQCVPQYLLPCTTAADCGDGFTCATVQDTACSGSGGAPTPVPDPAPTPNTPPDQGGGSGAGSGSSDCTTTTRTQCEPVVKECSADSDCPASWTCVEQDRPPIACGGSAERLPDGGTKVTPDDCPMTSPEPAKKLCVPPYFDFFGHNADDLGTSSNESGATGGIPPRSGSEQGTSGDAKGGSTAGADTPSDPSTPASGESADGSRSSDDGGCQMSAGRASTSGASLLALLGLTGLLRRRRQRAA